MPDILQAFDDPQLFGASFAQPSWLPWRSFLGAMFGLGMDDPAVQLACSCTGRVDGATAGPYREAWLVVGRRSGKSRILATIATYLACFHDWRPRLAAGETGVVMVLAADRDQAQVILGYVRGLLNANPMLRRMVTNEGAESIELKSRRVSIEIHTNSYRSPRGRTVIAALCDEVAFWRSDTSANPGEETVRALRPSLATLAPDSLLIGASSPYSCSGLLWNQYSKHYGREGSRTLVWQAPSRIMNPSLPAELVADALADDHEAASAEYLAEFRRDIVGYITAEVVDTCIVPGRHELCRALGAHYVGFLDPSGGSQDSFTLAIAHREVENRQDLPNSGNKQDLPNKPDRPNPDNKPDRPNSTINADCTNSRAVLDVIREVKPPFDPATVVAEFSRLLLDYGVAKATADKYAGFWVTAAFADHGVTVGQHAEPKSTLYGELLPALNSGRVDLLDNPRLRTQLLGLERRTARSGRDSIDHALGAHDDLINAAAGALVACLARAKTKMNLGDIIIGETMTATALFDDLDSGDRRDWQKDLELCRRQH